MDAPSRPDCPISDQLELESVAPMKMTPAAYSCITQANTYLELTLRN